MLIIEGGRSCLYQWDVDQRLEVVNPDVREVHFSNVATSPALISVVYEEGGRRFANIPNILLQQVWDIQAHGSCGSRVRDVQICKVIRRERPADYAYTETEVKTFDRLEKRLEDRIAELPQEIEAALTEAKESGEFDGYTPIKGLDYTDGAPGPGITDLTITGRTDATGRRYHHVVIMWEEALNGSVIKAGQSFDVYDGKDAPAESVCYAAQELTEEQQAQARNNIGAAGSDVVVLLNEKIEEKTKVASSVDADGTQAVSGAAVAAYVQDYMAQFAAYEEVAF